MGLWDMLFPNPAKDLSDMLDALGSSKTSTTAAGNQSLPAGLGGSSGSIQIQTGNTSAASIQSQLNSLQQALAAMGVSTGAAPSPNITAEEKEELERLRTEYASAFKAIKIAEFKKLPTELRQYVVNVFAWREAVQTINSTLPEKSERMIELEGKEKWGNMFKMYQSPYGGGASGQVLGGAGGTIGWSGGGQVYPQYSSTFPAGWSVADIALPDGITIEDLRAAHLEATLEEEMLNEQT